MLNQSVLKLCTRLHLPGHGSFFNASHLSSFAATFQLSSHLSICPSLSLALSCKVAACLPLALVFMTHLSIRPSFSLALSCKAAACLASFQNRLPEHLSILEFGSQLQSGSLSVRSSLFRPAHLSICPSLSLALSCKAAACLASALFFDSSGFIFREGEESFSWSSRLRPGGRISPGGRPPPLTRSASST